MPTATLYLLHFTKPLGHATHYLGYTNRPLNDRMDDHRKGRGAALMRALMQAGGDFLIAKTWTFDSGKKARDEERRRKRYNRHAKHCPICRGEVLVRPAKMGRVDRFINEVKRSFILPG